MIAINFDPNFFWLPLVGFVIGLLVTMFGGGGGFFYVPILTLLFNIPVQLAVATSLAAMIPTTIIGFIEHNRKGNVNIKIGIIFGIAGLAGTIAGAYVSNLFSALLLKKLFGIYAIVLTIPMLFTSINKGKKKNEEKKSQGMTGSKYILDMIPLPAKYLISSSLLSAMAVRRRESGEKAASKGWL